MTTIVEFDGASRGNPGPAGIGYRVLPGRRRRRGSRVHRQSHQQRGRVHRADPRPGERPSRRGYSEVIAEGDSWLVVRQVRGQYNVGADNLILLYKEARTLVEEFDEFEIRHVKRSKNEGADDLANEALDER